jgi:hypothetical protein
MDDANKCASQLPMHGAQAPHLWKYGECKIGPASELRCGCHTRHADSSGLNLRPREDSMKGRRMLTGPEEGPAGHRDRPVNPKRKAEKGRQTCLRARKPCRVPEPD